MVTINTHTEKKKTRYSVFFRADGSNQIGLGHVIRSLALADMLRANFKCTFAIREPSEELKTQIRKVCDQLIELPMPSDNLAEAQWLISECISPEDIVVVDGYHFVTDYQQIIKRNGNVLVCIDDIHAYHFIADMVINHAEGVDISQYSIESYTKLLIGFNYTLLRKPFIEIAKKHKQIKRLDTAFICFGGGDFLNLTSKTLVAIAAIETIKKIHVVVGSAYNSLPELSEEIKLIKKNKAIFLHQNLTDVEMISVMQDSHLAICPASSIAFEICSVKMAFICGYYVDNQLDTYYGLIARNCCLGVGSFNLVKQEELSNYVNYLTNNVMVVEKMISHQKEAVTGNSAENYSQIFNELCLSKF